jgi:3-hydroxy-9,10-secoandrosta-1,3,5(10)-triene-9,17-dione monooxygenase
MTSAVFDRGAVPSVGTMLERVAEIGPILRNNASVTEDGRRLTRESFDALESVGAFRILTLRRHGGYGMSARESMELLAAIGEYCGSSAWVVGVINACNWQASHLSVEGQAEVFGSGEVRVAGSMTPNGTARRADGGYVASGKWPFASGSWHANWAQLGIMLDRGDGNAPEHAVAYVPMSEVSVEETWFVAGMKGTGSNTLVVDGLFIPDQRLYAAREAAEDNFGAEYSDEPSSRAAFVPMLVLSLAGPQLGLGRAALQFVIEKASKRGVTGTTFKRQADSAGVQIQVARAAQLIETAHLHVFRAADATDRFAASGEAMPYVERARIRSDVACAINRILEAIELLLSVHGASSFADANPLQRIWRDAGTAARHAVANPTVNEELYGKALLGIPRNQNITRMI